MSAPIYARVETFLLEGYIDLHATLQLTSSICRRAFEEPPALYTVDCSKVRGFSGCALVGIARLRRELRSRGCELELVKCPPGVREKVVGALFESLLEDIAPIAEAVKAIQPLDEPIYEQDPEQIGLFADEMPPAYLHHVPIQWYWLN